MSDGKIEAGSVEKQFLLCAEENLRWYTARNAELIAALRCAEARLDQPVLHTNSENASGILRGDIRSALVAIRAALAKAVTP